MVERTSKGRNLACKILYVKPIILIKIVTIINIFKLFLKFDIKKPRFFNK